MNEADCCAEWKPQVGIIDGLIMLQFARRGTQYGGIPFRFCPWCGKARPASSGNSQGNPE